LKIRCASSDSSAAVQFATGTFVGKEFEIISPRCDRADDDPERAVPVEISGDNPYFHFCEGRGPPCLVAVAEVPPPPSVGNWPKFAGKGVQKKFRAT